MPEQFLSRKDLSYLYKLIYIRIVEFCRNNNYNKDFEEYYYHEEIIALTLAYDTYKDDCNVKFITYTSRCIHNKYKDIFKKKSFNEEPLDLQMKDDLYLLDIISSRKEKTFDMLIRKETKEELEKSWNKLSNDDNFIICSLYGIKVKK